MKRGLVGLVALCLTSLIAACSDTQAVNQVDEVVPNQQAIFDGWNDPGLFPEVCTITWSNPAEPTGQRFSLCTGVLLAPKVMVAAGHCAYIEKWGIYAEPKISCDRVFKPGSSREYSGHFEVIPSMDPENDIWDPDVSVFLLDQPIFRLVYAQLPPVGFNDRVFGHVKPGKGPEIVEVGYGASVEPYDGTEVLGTRRVTGARFSLLEDLFLWGDADPGYAMAGDSGGPAYLSFSRVLLGITILSWPPTMGYGRMDRADVQAFIGQYVRLR